MPGPETSHPSKGRRSHTRFSYATCCYQCFHHVLLPKGNEGGLWSHTELESLVTTQETRLWASYFKFLSHFLACQVRIKHIYLQGCCQDCFANSCKTLDEIQVSGLYLARICSHSIINCSFKIYRARKYRKSDF